MDGRISSRQRTTIGTGRLLVDLLEVFIATFWVSRTPFVPWLQLIGRRKYAGVYRVRHSQM